MNSQELTEKVNQRINQIGNRTNLLQRGGCLKKLKEDLEKIQQDIKETVSFINEINKGK